MDMQKEAGNEDHVHEASRRRTCGYHFMAATRALAERNPLRWTRWMCMDQPAEMAIERKRC
jgi:hypothetical protein